MYWQHSVGRQSCSIVMKAREVRWKSGLLQWRGKTAEQTKGLVHPRNLSWDPTERLLSRRKHPKQSKSYSSPPSGWRYKPQSCVYADWLLQNKSSNFCRRRCYIRKYTQGSACCDKGNHSTSLESKLSCKYVQLFLPAHQSSGACLVFTISLILQNPLQETGQPLARLDDGLRISFEDCQTPRSR